MTESSAHVIETVLTEHATWRWAPAHVSPDHLYVCDCGDGLELVTSPTAALRAHVAARVAEALAAQGGEALANAEWVDWCCDVSAQYVTTVEAAREAVGGLVNELMAPIIASIPSGTPQEVPIAQRASADAAHLLRIADDLPTMTVYGIKAAPILREVAQAYCLIPGVTPTPPQPSDALETRLRELADGIESTRENFIEGSLHRRLIEQHVRLIRDLLGAAQGES